MSPRKRDRWISLISLNESHAKLLAPRFRCRKSSNGVPYHTRQNRIQAIFPIQWCCKLDVWRAPQIWRPPYLDRSPVLVENTKSFSRKKNQKYRFHLCEKNLNKYKCRSGARSRQRGAHVCVRPSPPPPSSSQSHSRLDCKQVRLIELAVEYSSARTETW